MDPVVKLDFLQAVQKILPGLFRFEVKYDQASRDCPAYYANPTTGIRMALPFGPVDDLRHKPFPGYFRPFGAVRHYRYYSQTLVEILASNLEGCAISQCEIIACHVQAPEKLIRGKKGNRRLDSPAVPHV
jgi:hypothetical protein